MAVPFSFLRLRNNEKKTRKAVLSLQRERLCSLLHFVWEHSSYYRETFEAAGLVEQDLDHPDLSRFPIMDKETLIAHFDDIITTNNISQTIIRDFDAEHSMKEKELPGGYHIVHSSGSTGEAKFFLYDKKAWDEMLSGIVRGALWGMTIPQIIKLLMCGIRILYIAAVDGRYGGVMAIDDGVAGLGGKFRTLDINRPLSEWQDVISEYKPNVVIAYPSAMKILAELIREGKVSCRLKRVITCGEPLSASIRACLEKTFSLPIISFYGASESLALGVEVNKEEGMILFDDMNVIEHVNGELLITCLYNYVQPIIRYRIGDKMELFEPQKYPFFTMAKGEVFRDEDVLWFENENGQEEYLHPLAIEGFCVDGLLDFQFVQESRTSFKMLAQITGEERKEYIEDQMRLMMGKILKEKRLSNIRFDIDFEDKILPDEKSGKKHLVIAQSGNKR